MHPAAPQSAPLPVSASDSLAPSQATESHAGAGSCALILRVGRVLQDMNAGRAVTDAEILQHESDCRRLSEVVYGRFEATRNPADRDEAVLWQYRASEARRSLSDAYKAAREAQIQHQIAQGTGCYFMDQADRDRAALAGRAK